MCSNPNKYVLLARPRVGGHCSEYEIFVFILTQGMQRFVLQTWSQWNAKPGWSDGNFKCYSGHLTKWLHKAVSHLRAIAYILWNKNNKKHFINWNLLVRIKELKINRKYYNDNTNNIIYIALYTKVLKHFTMEKENRIIKLTLPKK